MNTDEESLREIAKVKDQRREVDESGARIWQLEEIVKQVHEAQAARIDWKAGTEFLKTLTTRPDHSERWPNPIQRQNEE